MSNEIENISKAVNDLGVKIEAGYATKGDLQKHAEAVSALSKAMDSKALADKKDRVFGSKAAAVDFINSMKQAIAVAGISIEKSSPFFMSKSDLDTSTSGSGPDMYPTATFSSLSYLLEQGSVNRREANVIMGIQGDLVLPKRTSATTSAVFTASDGAAVTADAFNTGKVTLSPKQISSLSYVADKLLYASAVNVAEMVAIDLSEQCGKLEDEAVIRGDGSATFGGVTGLNTATTGGHSVAAASFSIDDLLALTAEVAEEVQAGNNQKFYMNGTVLAALRQKKASTAGTYQFDVTTNSFTIAGKPIVVWNRMDSTLVATKIPVIYGDMKKAVTVGVGRDMTLIADRSFKFGSNQTAFRLTYDWQSQLLQGTAIAKVTLS